MRSQVLVAMTFACSLLMVCLIGVGAPRTLASDDITPEHIEVIEQVQCLTDSQLGGTNCSGNVGYCEEPFENVFRSFEGIPYTDCVLAICSNSQTDIVQIRAQRDQRASATKNDILRLMRPQIENVYEGISRQAQAAKEYFEQNPDFKVNVDINENAYVLMKVFLREIESNVDSELRDKMNNRRRFLEAFPRHFSTMTPAMGGYLYDMLQGLRRRTSQVANEIESLSLNVMNPEGRRLFLGRMEARIRALPEDSPQKHVLFNEILKLQSQNQIVRNPTNNFRDKAIEMTLELELLEHLTNEPSTVLLKTALYNEAKLRNLHVETMIGDIAVEGSDKDTFTDWCAGKIAEQAESFPTQQRRGQLSQQVNATRELIKRRMASQLSRETAAGTALAIDSIDISLPPAREDYLGRMRAHLQETTGMMGSFDARNRASAATHFSNIYPMNLTNNFCEFPLFEDMQASALSQVNQNHNGHVHNITMGNLFMQDFENVGKFVFAHEVGHVVSSHIREFGSRDSKSAHRETKRCLNNNQSGGVIDNLFGRITGDARAWGSKEEEDFADLYAQLALPYSNNPKCSMFNNGQPADLYDATLFSAEHAPHSADLYRLLQVEVVRSGRLPDVCRRELAAQGDDFREVNCWTDTQTVVERRERQLRNANQN